MQLHTLRNCKVEEHNSKELQIEQKILPPPLVPTLNFNLIEMQAFTGINKFPDQRGIF